MFTVTENESWDSYSVALTLNTQSAFPEEAMEISNVSEVEEVVSENILSGIIQALKDYKSTATQTYFLNTPLTTDAQKEVAVPVTVDDLEFEVCWDDNWLYGATLRIDVSVSEEFIDKYSNCDSEEFVVDFTLNDSLDDAVRIIQEEGSEIISEAIGEAYDLGLIPVVIEEEF